MSTKRNKHSRLVRAVAVRAPCATYATVRAVLAAFAEAVRFETASGRSVIVPGLGTFRPRRRVARDFMAGGRHHVVLAERLVLTFKAADAVRVLSVSPSSPAPRVLPPSARRSALSEEAA